MYLKYMLGSMQQRLYGPKADATSMLGSTLWNGEGKSAHLGLLPKEREIEEDLQLDFEMVQSSNIKIAESSAVLRKDKSLLS